MTNKVESYHPDPKCKICKIYDKNLELWQKIHIKVLQDGLSKAAVCTWANSQIEVLNKQYIMEGEKVIPKLNTDNFHSHFKKHVSANLSELWAIKHKAENTSSSRGYGTIDPEQTQLAGAFITNLAANGSGVDNYGIMQTMISSLESQIYAYSEYFTNFSKDNVGRLPDIKQVEIFQKIVQGFIQSKNDLSKFKNSEEIAGKAIEEALWKIVSDLTMNIKEVADSVKMRLQDVMGDKTSIPVEIENMIKMQFSEHARMVVPDIINKVKKDYKLQ